MPLGVGTCAPDRDRAAALNRPSSVTVEAVVALPAEALLKAAMDDADTLVVGGRLERPRLSVA